MKSKHIQIIDGAENCTYEIYAIEERHFNLIFPGDGQDIEFIEDFVERVGPEIAGKIMNLLWEKHIDKKSVVGIHGTLFFELLGKKQFYPSKIESEMIVSL